MQGDFISTEPPVVIETRLDAGASRLPVAASEQLPADFRLFKVSLSASGFTASRAVRRRDLPRRAPGRGTAAPLRPDRRGARRSRRRTPSPTRCARSPASPPAAAGPETEAMIAACLAGDRRLLGLRRLPARAAALGRAPLRRRHRPGLRARASTAPSSATATGSTSPATTSSGTSPRTTRCSSTPRPTSPATSCPTRASSAPAAPAPSSPPSAATASAPGSTTSSAGKWPSSTPPPTSRSTSRA